MIIYSFIDIEIFTLAQIFKDDLRLPVRMLYQWNLA